MKIRINAKEVDWPHTVITYLDLVMFTDSLNKGLLTIMVSYPKQDKKPHTITVGQTIEVLDGMVITAVRTGNA